MRTFATSVPTTATRHRAFAGRPAVPMRHVRSILHAPRIQPKLKAGAVNDQAEAEADHISSLGGICLKSFFGGEVMFVGLGTAQLASLAVINEPDGGGLTRPVVNNVWYDCDGYWQRGRAQWFKIPDHCAAEVSGLQPLVYEQCCNLAAGLFKQGPHWSSDALDASKANPFTE